MIRDVTLGRFLEGDGVLYKLDPRTKLLGTLMFIVSVFAFHTFWGYLVATVFLGSVILISKVPVKFIFKGLKAIFVLLLFTIVF